jgi:hypothetical protein
MKNYSILLVVFIFCTCSKKSETNSPVVSVSDISQNRPDTNSIFRFYIYLNNPAKNQISIDYQTLDGSAIANKDYIPVSGNLKINAGQSEATIDVIVTGDSLRQPYQQFYLQFSNLVNCTMITKQVSATIENDGTYLPTDTSGYTSPLSYPGYLLTWSDEFNSNSIDTNNWNFEIGGGGWGNNELEYYTGRIKNAFQSSGHLVIEATAENYEGSNYTSARMTSQNKQQFQYGRIDIRAKLPVGQGIWPALWMLGVDFPQVGWPACGETDIMELIGTYPQEIFGTIHWADSTGGNASSGSQFSIASGDFSMQFHVFSLIWKKDSISLLVDDQVFFNEQAGQVSNGNWPFNNPYFFILNVAVGCNWPGSPAATTTFPEFLFVDYIRVFQ